MADLTAASPTAQPTDLPPHIVSLARAIARECAAPGHYTIDIIVPCYPREPVGAVIIRTDTIRIMEISR